MNKKKFDRQEVLESAMQLFWKKGYHSTSTRELQNVTTLKPGSLYGAFTNKETLFTEALGCYAQILISDLTACRDKNDNPLESLKEFSIQVVTDKSTPSKLCFLHKSYAEVDNDELRGVLEKYYKEVESLFLQIFVDAIEGKYIGTSESAGRLVKKYQMQLLGWRAYLSSSSDEKFVKEMISEFFNGFNTLE